MKLDWLGSLFSLALMMGHLISGQTPEPSQPPDIRFPEQQAAPVPPIPPAPNASIKLVKGQIYAIQSSKPLVIRQRGAGKVIITPGPASITLPIEVAQGWKPDATDLPGYVTLKGPYNYLVKGAASGDLSLEIIPALNGVDKAGKPVLLKESDILDKAFTVDLGDSPDPNPNPNPNPNPQPEPPPGPKASHVWVIIVEETSARTPEAIRIIGDATYWKTILDRGHKFRFYDVNSPEAKASGYADKAKAVGLPALIVVDQATGKTLKSVRLPADATGIDDIVKEVTK